MKPFEHGKVSVRKWGGKAEDYQEIHDFIDSSKACHPDMRHRAIYHNSLGPFLAEKIYGIWEWEFKGRKLNPFSWANWQYVKRPFILNSSGKKVQVRDIVEQHIIDDMGFIPTITDYLSEMPLYEWLGGPKRARAAFKIVD